MFAIRYYHSDIPQNIYNILASWHQSTTTTILASSLSFLLVGFLLLGFFLASSWLCLSQRLPLCWLLGFPSSLSPSLSFSLPHTHSILRRSSSKHHISSNAHDKTTPRSSALHHFTQEHKTAIDISRPPITIPYHRPLSSPITVPYHPPLPSTPASLICG